MPLHCFVSANEKQKIDKALLYFVIYMVEGYGSQKDYMEWVKDSADERNLKIRNSLKIAFKDFIETKEVEIIVFSDMTSSDIGLSILNHPNVLKPILSICNIAARAIERDLGIRDLDTYNPNISRDKAMQIAGYLKQFLPPYAEIPTLTRIDRVYFVDKKIRKRKGKWEKTIIHYLNEISGNVFKKRLFECSGDKFEIDAAYPKTGSILIGIDIKRVEAKRDIPKRTDEIVNKANKLKLAYPNSYFIAIIYYPFVDQHINVENRLKSDNIDEVIFASQSEDNILNACQMLFSSIKNRIQNNRGDDL